MSTVIGGKMFFKEKLSYVVSRPMAGKWLSRAKQNNKMTIISELQKLGEEGQSFFFW